MPPEPLNHPGVRPLKGDPLDHAKVKIIDGVIHYRVRQQDGSMQPMTAPDTQHNRQIVSWIQIHD
jgi:hypothetical protein